MYKCHEMCSINESVREVLFIEDQKVGQIS